MVRRQPRACIAYCMTARADAGEPAAERREPGNDTRLVSIDIATGAATDVPAGPGVKIQSVAARTDDVGYIRKDTATPAPASTTRAASAGRRATCATAAWSPDGTRVVFHKRLTAPPTVWQKICSRNPGLRADADRHPAVVQPGRRSVRDDRPPGRRSDPRREHRGRRDRHGQVRGDLRGQDAATCSAPQWSPSGDTIIFGIGAFNAFFNGFNGLFLKPGIASRAARRSRSSTPTAAGSAK